MIANDCNGILTESQITKNYAFIENCEVYIYFDLKAKHIVTWNVVVI